MCRWLKASGVSIACEEGMGKIARDIIKDSLRGEIALFSFKIPSGGEELRGAPLVSEPNGSSSVRGKSQVPYYLCMLQKCILGLCAQCWMAHLA